MKRTALLLLGFIFIAFSTAFPHPVQVFLQFFLVFIIYNFSVNHTVISKKSNSRFFGVIAFQNKSMNTTYWKQQSSPTGAGLGLARNQLNFITASSEAVIQFCIQHGICQTANLYDVYHSCVYGEKLLMMDRGTVRNLSSFIPKINLKI